MVRHLAAVEGDEDVRNWLLDYNLGDVEANRTVRDWMDGPGREVLEVPTD